MGFFTSLASAQNAAPNRITTSKDLDDWLRFGGQQVDAGVDVNTSSAEGLAAVAVCVRALSDPLAHLPLVLYRRTETGREPARNLGLFRLLHDSPNRVQSSFQWRKIMMRDMLLRGNAYSVITGRMTDPSSLMRLHPDQVKVEQLNGGRLQYVHKSGGSEQTIPQDRMLHVWKDSDDGITGLNPIQVHRNTIGDGIALRKHGSKFFSNAARLTGTLEIPEGKKIGEEAAKALRDDFESTYSGNENARRTAVLPEGIKFNPVSISMADAQWIEATKAKARQIHGIFGVPSHKGGDLEKVTQSNVENQNLEFVIDAITPWAVCWEQAINRDILGGDPNLFVKFNMTALLRGDYKSRQEGLQIQRRNGVVSANEWRELEDMNPREDEFGSRYIVESNMQDDTDEFNDDDNQS